jgi:uncharacterized repeat protein (TIGR02543 family)
LKPKAVIRLSKRFLIVAALTIFVLGSLIAVIPVRAPSDSKIVYVAICCDTENMNGISPWYGSSDPHPTLDVSEYSRTAPSTVAAVFNSDYRNSRRDSFGNTFKISWFAEMDYFYAQSNFVWADGSPAGVSGYTATYDLLENIWGTEIQTYGDSIEYHHHFVTYDGTWQPHDSGPDAGYPEYQMYALDHMIIDRNFYPSSWRSGMWIMPPALSSWLEQWMPFDYTPSYITGTENNTWFPVHPSGMDRWQTLCPYGEVSWETNDAFAYARDHGSAIYSFCTHDKEDNCAHIDWLQYCLNKADADEATYPNVKFKYVTAREAMQLALGFTDFTPPTFTVTSSGINTYTIVSNEPLWKNHPYVALKYTNGTYGHMSATPAGANTWTVTPPRAWELSAIGVGASDLCGNPGAATVPVTLEQYALTVGTVGSGSVTKSPDQATYASGTPVQLTAVPYPGWSFKAWSGALTGSANPASLTVTGDMAVTATFMWNGYSLTVSVVGSGSVVKTPDQASYNLGDKVTLTANPADGWSFSGWSGALTGSANPASLTVTGDMAVTATFARERATVYVVFAVDSEMWSGHDPYIGSTTAHPIMDMRAYSRTSPLTVAPVFDSNFRNSHRDSFGNTFKMTWFAEMDYLMAQSSFVWADGSPAGVSGYTAIHDILQNNWGTEMQLYGDSIENHHHFMVYTDAWHVYDQGPDAGYPEYQMYALDHMILDRNFYPSDFRAGWNINKPALSNWLEQWIPFDYGPTTGIWYPTQPVGETRWQTRSAASPYQDEVNQAFAYASENGSAIYSLTFHDRDSMAYFIDVLQTYLNNAASNPAYSNVRFEYASATKAMQLALGFNDFTPPVFTITRTGTTYTITSSEAVWQNHPYVALKEADGTYMHPTAVAVGTNTWTVDASALLEKIGVAASDLYGNTGVAVMDAQNAYSLTVSTVGSGSVVKIPDLASYHLGDVVELTAVPSTGWSFDHWSQDLTGSSNPATVTITGNMAVTAHFTENTYTLTVNVVGTGCSVSRDNNGPYHYNDVVHLTANAAVGWTFSQWSGALTGNANPAALTITGDMAVTATFAENLYTLTITVPSGGGSVSKSPDQATYTYGTIVTLTASPVAGWSFSHWSGDLSGSTSPAYLTIDGDKSVTATFTQNEYTLTISTSGSGTVSTDKSAPYHYGDVVQLTANPVVGWSFSAWSGDLVSTTNPDSITMTGSKTVTATFTQNTYTLTVTIIGTGSVGLSDNGPYHYGDIVELTANPAAGWNFDHWSGDLGGSINPTTILIDSNRAATATFIQNGYTLTVSTVGSGSVAKSPDQASYHYGDVVQLMATPSAGWSFSSWSGSLTGSANPASLTITGDMAVTATFTQIFYEIMVTQSAHGTISPSTASYAKGTSPVETVTPDVGYHIASVTVDDISVPVTSPSGQTVSFSNIDQGHLITASFAVDQFTITVTQTSNGVIAPDTTIVNYGGSQSFTITPNTGYHIVDVLVDSISKGPVASWDFTDVKEDHTITATFAQNEYSLTIIVAPSSAAGSVSASIPGPYHLNDVVTLTPTANPGYTFSGWSGGLVGNPVSVTITGDLVVTATFTQDQYTLAISTVGSGSVTKNPDQLTYTYGTVVTLAATANTGWTFTGWSGDASGIDPSVTVIMNGNRAVTATFTQNSYAVVFTETGLPAETQWSATLGGNTLSSTTATITFNVLSGTYSWSVTNPISGGSRTRYFTATSSGTIGVTQQTSISITYVTQYQVSFARAPSRGGTTSPSGTNVWTTAGSIQISATANSGYVFNQWSTSTSSITIDNVKSATATATINGPGTITANFVAATYTVTFQESNLPSGTSWSATLNGVTHTSTTNTITFTIAAGTYSWSVSNQISGGTGTRYVTSTPSGRITVTGTTTIQIQYRTQYYLTMQVTPAGAGTTSPSSGWHDAGTTVTISATARTGHAFISWTGTGSGSYTGTSRTSSVIMNSPITETATFT